MNTLKIIIISSIFLFLQSCKKHELKSDKTGSENTEIMTKDGDAFPSPLVGPCQIKSNDLKVLFIGNSFTANYTTDIPLMFKELALNSGKTFISVSTAAVTGYRLANHLASSATMNLISQGGWDYVVLQENAGDLAWGNPSITHPAFKNSVAGLVTALNSSSPGSEILLFEVPPMADPLTGDFDTQLADLNNLFSTTANLYGNVSVCNVAQAHHDVYNSLFPAGGTDQLRYDMQYQFHFKNPGGFLAAITIYGAIFNDKPCLPTSLTFYGGVAPIVGNIPTLHPLVDIGYYQGVLSTNAVPAKCVTYWAPGVYPC